MPRDQRGKEKAKPIEEEIGVEAKRGQPIDPDLDHLAAKYRGRVQHQANKGQKAGQTCGRGRGIASGADKQSGKHRSEKRQGRNQKQGHVQFSWLGFRH